MSSLLPAFRWLGFRVALSVAALALVPLSSCDATPGDAEPEREPESEPEPNDGGLADAGLRDAGQGDGGIVDAGSIPPDAGPPPFQDLRPGAMWEWRLGAALDTAPAIETLEVEMIDLDLDETPAARIAELKATGLVVICYFSAGTAEDFRDDLDVLVAADQGNALVDWPDERWLDVRSSTVRALASSRIARAAVKGCDGVEPDNVDAYANASGFDLQPADQLAFNRFLAAEAHALRLSVGLKNDVEQVAALESVFDWALNEECLSFNECGVYSVFLGAQKAVFHVEYVDTAAEGLSRQAQVCAEPSRSGMSSLVKTWDLDAVRFPCID